MLSAILVASAGATSFVDHLQTPIEQVLVDALLTIPRNIPTQAASSGAAFRYDPRLGTFVRVPDLFGQVFLERPQSIGRGVWNLGVSYEHVSADTFEGHAFDRLRDTRRIVDGDVLVRVRRFGIAVDTDQALLAATYGITDDAEVGLVVPVLSTAFRFDAVFNGTEVLADGKEIDLPPIRARVRSTKVGIGDVVLRGKYRLTAMKWLASAVGLVVRLPSGARENFQGTGTPEVTPMLYLSTDSVDLTADLALRPYVNGGVDLVADDVGASEARWGVGLDLQCFQRATLGVAVLGRHAFARLAAPGTFDVPREAGGHTPIFGLAGARPDYYDLAFGARTYLWGEHLMGFVHVVLPVNRDGVRSDAIPVVGVEATL